MSKLLMVVDYQNDFVTGSLGFDGAAAIDDGIAHLVQSYLAVGDHVLFTYDTHDDTYLDTQPQERWLAALRKNAGTLLRNLCEQSNPHRTEAYFRHAAGRSNAARSAASRFE